LRAARLDRADVHRKAVALLRALDGDGAGLRVVNRAGFSGGRFA
jgi:hypothetical protein